MQTVIALLRGINVGGRNKLPMADLRALLEGMGYTDVKTYIQSGNAVFRTDAAVRDELAARIGQAIEAQHGFRPQVLLIDLDALQRAIAANPFPAGEEDAKTLHLYFLAEAPSAPDLASLEEVRQESERFALGDGIFYLYAPQGIGRSKLAERVERALGVPTTARNWRSANKIRELAESIDHD